MENIVMTPETNTEVTPETTETNTEVTPAIQDVDFEKLYKSEKKRNKRLFIGGTFLGGFSAFFYLKRMQPGLKALKEKRKAEKAEKKAAKKAAKEALAASENTEN